MRTCVSLWPAALRVILDAAEEPEQPQSHSDEIGRLLASISALVNGDRICFVRASARSTNSSVMVDYPLNARPEGHRTFHRLRLDLSYRSGESMFIAVDRWAGPPFDEADRLILRLLRPHLDLAFRRIASPVPRLTAREIDVLLRVRDGLGNAEIAKQLGVAEATVVKHLEHVFRRSGAHSRTEAVRICEPAMF